MGTARGPEEKGRFEQAPGANPLLSRLGEEGRQAPRSLTMR